MAQRRPHPAYFEYLYIQVGLTVASGVLLLFIGEAPVGGLLLLVALAELAAVRIYQRRKQV